MLLPSAQSIANREGHVGAALKRNLGECLAMNSCTQISIISSRADMLMMLRACRMGVVTKFCWQMSARFLTHSQHC